MSLSVLSDVLEAAPQFERLRASMGQSRVHVRLQVLPNGVPMTLATLARNVDVPVLLVVPRPDEARRLYEQVSLWSADERSVLHFPESETLPFERLVTDTDTEQQRIGVLARLLADDSPDGGSPPGPSIIIASASAISQKTVSRESFEKNLHRLVPGQTLDLPGTAGRRGGIIDVYPVGKDFTPTYPHSPIDFCQLSPKSGEPALTTKCSQQHLTPPHFPLFQLRNRHPIDIRQSAQFLVHG